MQTLSPFIFIMERGYVMQQNELTPEERKKVKPLSDLCGYTDVLIKNLNADTRNNKDAFEQAISDKFRSALYNDYMILACTFLYIPVHYFAWKDGAILQYGGLMVMYAISLIAFFYTLYAAFLDVNQNKYIYRLQKHSKVTITGSRHEPPNVISLKTYQSAYNHQPYYLTITVYGPKGKPFGQETWRIE